MNEPLEVHVLGAKRGESIVVRLPDDQWGVVDTFTDTAGLKQPEKNPTVKFLRSRGVQQLSFLCLTHPHVDHYMGMGYLLENFNPHKIWLFGGASSRCLWERLAFSVKAAAEAKPLDIGDSESADELVKIFNRVEDYHRDTKRVPRVEVLRLQLRMRLLELSCDPSLHITAIAE